MMEFVVGFFLGSLQVPLLLWSELAWWGLLVVLLGGIATEVQVYKNNGGVAFVFLFLTFFFVNFLLFASTPDVGLFGYIWGTIKLTIAAIGKYVLLGLATVPFLWFRYYRKYYVNLREKLNAFIATVATNAHSFYIRSSEIPLTEEQQEQCRVYKSGEAIPESVVCLWKRYREEELRIEDNAIAISNNIYVVGSFIFLWPFHILTLLFGDIIEQIPVWFATYIGPMIDSISRIMRFGIPKNID